jgi:cyanophycinase-like exopeptidase
MSALLRRANEAPGVRDDRGHHTKSNYVYYWKGTPVENAIHDLAERGVPIGGTSAGTAILSEFIYAAQRQSVTSAH